MSGDPAEAGNGYHVCVGGRGVLRGTAQYHGQLPSALLERMWVPWAAPTPPDNCLKWASAIERLVERNPAPGSGERIYQVSLKTGGCLYLK